MQRSTIAHCTQRVDIDSGFHTVQDSEEESRAVVEEFFQHTKSPEQERKRELREMYRQRRKNSNEEEGNNW